MPCSLSPARQPRWWLPSPQAQKEPRWAEQAEASVNQRSVPNSAAIVVSERTWEDVQFLKLKVLTQGLYVQFLKRKVLTQLKSKLLRGLAGGRAMRRPSEVCGERDGIKVLRVARGCPRPSPVPAPAPPLASRQLPRCTHAASLSF